MVSAAPAARHVSAFAKALGLARIDLLGLSLGGMVARQVALVRETRVAVSRPGLVLMDDAIVGRSP